ncbi:MAG: DUF192 domain-containing protein [Candidatus Methanoperedens sp.]|nr:DUF192 domain-containing protein [Candidatus Methanoperedens sp.]
MKLLFFLIFVIIFILFVLISPEKIRENAVWTNSTVCFGSSCIDVELATTPGEMTIGLMNRTSLPENRGMLFIFDEESSHKFWMKNTLIPLDIIWLDNNEKIIFIERNTQPCYIPVCSTFGPESGSKYALEVNGGFAEKNKIEVGDIARIYIK